MSRAVVLLTIILGSFHNLQAQDFQHIAPKEPPKTAPGQVVNEQGNPLAKGSNTEVLVGRLKGIRLVSNPKDVRVDGISQGPALEPGDVVLAHDADFPPVVAPYIGQPVTMVSLAELTRAVVAYYRAHDRPVVNVYVPQQNITNGYVQVVVVESRVEKIEATGARYFSNDDLRDEVSLIPSESISANAMRESLNWINRNPFLQSDLLLAPGAVPGTSDLLLRTQDRFPLRVYTGYEDSGNQYTGDDRFFGGFNYGNLFGLGQQLSYQFTTGENIDEFYAHSATYIIPLPWRHQLTFFGSYAATDASLAPGLESGGVNWQISGRYEVPLPGSAKFTESLTAGFDFKRNNNTLLFNVASVSDNNADVDQFVLGYSASYVDDYGSTSASATGFWSPGGISAYDNDNDYAQQQPGTRDNYVYGQITLNRVTRLPFDFSWTLRGELQESTANLLATEQIGLGGYATVRGYDEREANGDNGFLISNEIATPPVSIFGFFGCETVKDQLQFIAFVDYGGTSLHQVAADNPEPNPDTNLLGVGPGLRYAINPYLSLRFDYGFQLIDTGFDTRHNSRAHLGVVVSY